MIDPARLPFPVAAPLASMRREPEPGRRLNLVVHTFSEVVRTIGLIQISDLFAGGLVRDEDRVESVVELARPSLGHWVRAVKVLVPRDDDVASSTPFAPEWGDVSRRLAEQTFRNCVGLDLHDASRSLSPLDAVVSLRNALAHGGRPPPRDLAAELADRYGAIVEHVLDECAFLTDVQISRVMSERSVVDLNGPSALPQPADELPSTDLPEGVCFARRSDGRVLVLDPMVIGAESGWDTDPLVDPLFTFEGMRGRRVVYLGRTRKLESADRFEEVVEGISPPADDLTTPDQRRWRAATAAAVAANLGSKYQPGLYIERERVAPLVRRFLAGIDGIVGLAVSADAGAGKTSLLCDVASELLRTGERTPLLVNCRELTSGTSPLIDAVVGAATDDGRAALRSLGDEVSDLVVLLDAVNEAASPAAVIDDVRTLVRYARRAGGPRVVLSVRTEARRTLEATGAGWLPTPRAWLHDVDHLGEEQPYIELPRFSDDEVARAYGRFEREHRRDPTSPLCLTSYPDLTREVRRLLRDPLLLRVFMETYDGQQVPERTTGHEVFRTFHRDHLSSADADVAMRLASHVLERGQRTIPPVDDTPTGQAPTPADAAARSIYSTPRDRLVDAGVLLRHEDGAVSFAHQRHLEHLMAELLDGGHDLSSVLAVARRQLVEPDALEEVVHALHVVVRQHVRASPTLARHLVGLFDSPGGQRFVTAVMAGLDDLPDAMEALVAGATSAGVAELRATVTTCRVLGARAAEEEASDALIDRLPPGTERVEEQLRQVRRLVWLDRWDAAAATLAELTETVGDVGRLLQARIRSEQGYLHFARADSVEGVHAYTEALRLLDDAAVDEDASETLRLRHELHRGRGCCYHNLDHNEAARTDHAAAVRIARQADSRRDEALGLVNLADALWGLHDYGASLDRYEDAIELARAAAFQDAMDIALIGSGIVQWSVGRYGRATELLDQGIVLAERLGIAWDQIYGRIYRAACLDSMRQSETAATSLAEARADARRLGAPYLELLALTYELYAATRTSRRSAELVIAASDGIESAEALGIAGLADQLATVRAIALVGAPGCRDAVADVRDRLVSRPRTKGVWERMGAQLVEGLWQSGDAHSIDVVEELEDVVDAMVDAKAGSLPASLQSTYLSSTR